MQIYTDGFVDKNGAKSNTGGNGFIVVEHKEIVHKFIEKTKDTTNNREELKALINAHLWCLENYIHHPIVFTDSEYCQKGLTIWSLNWKSNGWKKAKKSKQLVKNSDLWIELEALHKTINSEVVWVKAHQKPGNSIEGDCNNLIDELITDFCNQI